MPRSSIRGTAARKWCLVVVGPPPGRALDPVATGRQQVLWVGIALATVVLGLALVRLLRPRPTP